MNVDICLVTWPNSPARLEYFTRTVDALLAFSDAGRCRWYCSAETHSTDERPLLRRELETLCEHYAIELSWRLADPDVAANQNRALMMGRADYVIPVHDDFELNGRLDIAASIAFLDGHPKYCAIRYQYPKGTWFAFPDVAGFREVDLEKTCWAFLESPSMRRRSMMDRYGPFETGLPYQAAEYCYGRHLARMGARVAATPISMFDHIGDQSAFLQDSGIPSQQNRRLPRRPQPAGSAGRGMSPASK